MLHVIRLNVSLFNVMLNVNMVSVVILYVVMLSVVMLSVVMLNVVAPLLILKKCFILFYKRRYLNEEVNCTDPSPSVRVPWVVVLPFFHKIIEFETGLLNI